LGAGAGHVITVEGTVRTEGGGRERKINKRSRKETFSGKKRGQISKCAGRSRVPGKKRGVLAKKPEFETSNQKTTKESLRWERKKSGDILSGFFQRRGIHERQG